MTRGKKATKAGCDLAWCDRPVRALGLCNAHYQRSIKGLDLTKPLKIIDPARGCKVAGCVRPHASLGYCEGHYQRNADGRDLSKPLQKKQGGEWGDWKTNKKGYVYRQRSKGPRGAVVRHEQLQHRVVMSEMLGRPLRRQETPHHKNGQRDDNRPENLELWSTSQPAGQRVIDKITWAREFIKQYGDEFPETK